MPLRTQKVSIDFGLGVDEFTDRKLVKEGKLIKAENVHFDGSKNVQKRAGFRTQVMHDLEGNPIDAPNNVFKYKNSPIVFSNNKIYTDAGSSSISESVRWRDANVFNMPSKAAQVGVGSIPSATDSATANIEKISSDQATLSSGVRCCVWGSVTTSGNPQNYIGVHVYDSVTGDILLDSKAEEIGVDAFTCVKVVPFGSQGSTPDRFIIVGTGWNSSVNEYAYYVFAVTIDSNSVPHIENKGTLSTFANMIMPPTIMAALDKRFSLAYEESSSKIFFTDCPFALVGAVGHYRPRVIRIEESPTPSGFQGSEQGSALLLSAVPADVDVANISSFLSNAASDEISFAISLKSEFPSGAGVVEKRVINGVSDSAASPMTLGNILTESAVPAATNEFPSSYLVTGVEYLRTHDGSINNNHFLLTHFASTASTSALGVGLVGNDYQEYSALYTIGAPPLTNLIIQKSVKPFVGIRSSMLSKQVGGTGNEYLFFAASKKLNKINLDTDNFGTEFLLATKIDTLTNTLSDRSHCVAKMAQGSTFCGKSGQTEPRNTSSLESVGDTVSFSSVRLPSSDLRSIDSITVDLDPNTQAVEMDGGLYTSGGFLKVFNGSEYVENNFHFAPSVMDFDEPAVNPWTPSTEIFNEKFYDDRDLSSVEYGVATSTNPTYQFCFTYEWTDSDGNIHVSAPSEIIQIRGSAATALGDAAAGTDGGIDFYVCPLIGDMTEKNNVTLKGYRTLDIVDDTSPGVALELFYDGHIDASAYAITPGPYGLLKYTFKRPDSELVQENRLYVSNGVLPNIPPPSIEKMISHDGRLFLLSSENKSRIYYSKPKLRLSSMEFSDFHYIESTSDGGDINSIASLSGKLFMFKNELTLASYGSPLNESGTSGGYSPPTAFSQSIGCTNPDSVKSTDSGIFFQFYNNIYSIDRSLRLNEVGLDVGDSITSVSSIIHLSDLNELRICHDEGTVIYNTLFNQWYTSSLTTKNNSISVNGRQFCIDKSSLDLLQEDPDYFGDGSTPISTDIETAWIKMAGPQGFQRIRNLLLLGELSADTTFKLELFYDYNTYPSETINITASDIASLASYGGGATYGGTTYYGGNSIDRVFQFRHKPKIQKCESMKLRIVETSLTTPTKGYALNNMLLEVAAKQSAFKMKNAKTV